MRKDELELWLGQTVTVHPKRYTYLIKKWHRKGWMKGFELTEKGKQEVKIIKDTRKSDYIHSLNGRIVIVEFLYMAPIVGCLRDCGDNGIHFYTRGTMKQIFSSYYLGESYRLDHVASIRLHPNPRKIFNRLNYIAWKISNPPYRHEDAFHITNHSYYWRTPEGIDPKACHSSCQCQNFPK